MDNNKALGASGAGQKVFAKGKMWTILPPTRKILAEFQAWLEARARRTVVASKGDLDDETYELHTERMLEAVTTGKYEWGGRAAKKALRTSSGMLQMLTLLFQQAHPKVKEDDVRDILLEAKDEVMLAFQSLVTSSLPNAVGATVTGAEAPQQPNSSPNSSEETSDDAA